jgi:hypothetical protein
MSEDIGFERLVDLTKLRWRIERDYQELKQEFGFGQYEVLGWRGQHHHMTPCVAVYGFLIAERAAIPPSDANTSSEPQASFVSNRHRSKCAADTHRAARRKLHSDHASTAHRCPGATPRTMPMFHAPSLTRLRCM